MKHGLSQTAPLHRSHLPWRALHVSSATSYHPDLTVRRFAQLCQRRECAHVPTGTPSMLLKLFRKQPHPRPSFAHDASISGALERRVSAIDFRPSGGFLKDQRQCKRSVTLPGWTQPSLNKRRIARSLQVCLVRPSAGADCHQSRSIVGAHLWRLQTSCMHGCSCDHSVALATQHSVPRALFFTPMSWPYTRRSLHQALAKPARRLLYLL
jgi:hypothetical protein